MGDDDPRLHWRRLHGLSPVAQGSSSPARCLIEPIHDVSEPPSGGFSSTANYIHHPAERRMLPVLHLDPAIKPAAAIAPPTRRDPGPLWLIWGLGRKPLQAAVAAVRGHHVYAPFFPRNIPNLTVERAAQTETALSGIQTKCHGSGADGLLAGQRKERVKWHKRDLRRGD
jgi:hypothetical protein